MPGLRILLLSDGRAGHFNLSEGIVAAVARRRSVCVTRLAVHRRRLVAGRVAAALVSAGISDRSILRLVYGIAAEAIPPADLVVSAGAETLAANAVIARMHGIANIFYGSLRAFDPAWFALVLTSYAAQVREPHPVMTLKPSRLDPDTLPAVTLKPGQPPARAGLLVGGDAGETQFGDADWSALLDLVEATRARWGTRWIVSNSRRTPGIVSETLAAAERRGVIDTFIDVRRAGSGTLEQLFTAAELVLVTADSSSMLSEAVWSRRLVVALEPARHALTPFERDYRAYLERAGTCRSLPIARASTEALMQLIGQVTPLSHNPLDHLAELVGRKIPALFRPG